MPGRCLQEERAALERALWRLSASDHELMREAVLFHAKPVTDRAAAAAAGRQ